MQQPTPSQPNVTKRKFARLLFLTMTLFLVLALSPSKAKAATDCNIVTEIPVAECQALVALYNSTNGPNWIRQERWLVTDNPCHWYGIVCTTGPMARYVSEIKLGDNQLSGDIPAAFGNLTSLRNLELYNNQLSSVPPEIGNLTSLQYLSLDNNQLSSLPAEIGNLTSLQNLGLHNNQLSNIPPEIGNLTNLQTLYIFSNQLSSLPAEIGNLSSLQWLYVTDNQLSNLPAEIGSLTSLQYLFLSNNQLSSVPSEIGNLSSLYYLMLGGNQLSSVPTEIGNLTSLLYLDLNSNQLSSLLTEITTLTGLEALNLSVNQLSSLPAEIGNLSSLQQLYLDNNQLSSVPTEIGNLSSLNYLHIRSNQLSSVPTEIGNLSNLLELYLSDNQLSSVPPEISNLTNLAQLLLSDNQLSIVPTEIGNLTRLDYLYLNSNPFLSGPLPSSLMQLTSLYGFDFSDTNLCEPGGTAFQSWLANIPDLQRTNVICSGTGKVTIVLDSQPNSGQDFFFEGDLGFFQLDNIIPDDGDAYTEAKSFDVEPGVYMVDEHVPGNFVLTDISCEPAVGSTIDLANNGVTIAVAGNTHVTCTFTNQRTSAVRAIAYDDRNRNGKMNGGDRPLQNWQVLLYNDQGNTVPTENDLTNKEGKEGRTHLPPGNYTICLVLKTGWHSTQPGTTHSVYGHPCYDVSLEPGTIVQVSFGASDKRPRNIVGTAQVEGAEDMLLLAMPETEEVFTDEEWLTTPLQMPGLFIPLIVDDGS